LLARKSSSEGSSTVSCGLFWSFSAGDPGDGGVFDLVVYGELVADIRLTDIRRCSLGSVVSDALGDNADPSTWAGVNGWSPRFPFCEFDLLKSPDIARFIPESFVDIGDAVGLFCSGDLGCCESATGVLSCFPAEGGGVAGVFSIRGGLICKGAKV
jgi:hypothetical protein